MKYLDNWEIVKKIDEGGQGKIFKVKNKKNGVFGALKLLHNSDEKRSERRGRIAREIITLRSLDVIGIPKVFESNESQLEDLSVNLYMVCEWINGVTLLEFRQKNKIDVMSATLITEKIIDIIEVFHRQDIVHRDIKPDNIMVEFVNCDELKVYVIDFGIAWSPCEESEAIETKTQQGLGNRFLELPELKPGRNIRDSRSDLTYLVGIYFFLLFNKYPRILLDENGKMPQSSISELDFPEIANHQRWSSIKRIFSIGFQQNINHRFESVSELRLLINANSDVSAMASNIEKEKDRLRSLFQSSENLELEKIQDSMMGAAKIFLNKIQQEVGSVGLICGGSGPNIDTDRRTCLCKFFAVKSQTSHPQVHFCLRIQFSSGRINAIVSVGDRADSTYYSGSVADSIGLEKACSETAIITSEYIISDFCDKFK